MKLSTVFMSLLIVVTLYVSGDTVTVAWDVVTGAVSYGVQVIRDTGEATNYSTMDTTYTIPRISAGRYTVKVWGVDSNGNSGSVCASVDPTCAVLKTGDAGSWEIEWNPTPPGPVTNSP